MPPPHFPRPCPHPNRETQICASPQRHTWRLTLILPTVVVGLPFTTLQYEALLTAVLPIRHRLVEDYAVIPHHRQGKGLDVAARAEHRAWL